MGINIAHMYEWNGERGQAVTRDQETCVVAVDCLLLSEELNEEITQCI